MRAGGLLGKTKRTHVARCLIPLCLVGVGALALAPTAGATNFTGTFDTDNQGVVVQEFGPGGPVGSPFAPVHVPTDGNPGGFIRFQDPGSGPSEPLASFKLLEDLDPIDYGATVSFDTRTTGTEFHGGAGGIVYGVVRDDANGLICRLGAPNAVWTHYSFTIEAGGCLENNSFLPATKAEIDAVLAGNTRLEFNADFAESAGELVDLDNVIVDGTPPLAERQITLSYDVKAKKFSGKVTGGDDECTAGVDVELVRKGESEPIDFVETKPNGKFSVSKKAKKGKKYRAEAPEFEGELETCGEAISKAVKG